MILIKHGGLCILSSVLLVLSFPDWDIGILAWVALVPLLHVLSGRGALGGFCFCFLCGVFFFLGIFNWILTVSYYHSYHHAILAFYLGSYFGCFGLGFGYISKCLGRPAALLAAPFIWIVLEYIRGNFFFLALPWGFLGHTQYQFPHVIQIAALFGTYAVSFIVVLVNAAFAQAIHRIPVLFDRKVHCSQPHRFTKTDQVLFGAAVLSILTSFIYGYRIINAPMTGVPFRISLVQGNIEQIKKWDPAYSDEIMKIYSNLSNMTSMHQPDLIVWPETATPGSITVNPEIFEKVGKIVNNTGIPHLLGSAQHQKYVKNLTEMPKLVNSAFLVIPGKEYERIQQYDKIRLFPFGEYLPYKNILPWELIHVASLNEYVQGTEYTIFHFYPYRFGVTICWENIFPDLVRQFARRGSQFIINITNEARFGKTAAPYQLAAISVFRAVENKTYVIRCANTGVSCIIDPFGRIVSRLKDIKGEDLFTRGVLTGKIIPRHTGSLYTRFGDWLIFISLIVSICFILFAARYRKEVWR